MTAYTFVQPRIMERIGNTEKRVDHRDDRVYICVATDHGAYLQLREAC